MSSRASEKIIEGLSQFMEGFQQLQELVEADYEDESSEDDEGETNSEMAVAILTEVRAALESVMDVEDYSTEEVATALSTLTEALEELDPDVFEREGEEEEAFAAPDEDDDDDYYDDEDDDLDFDEDEEDEDEDEDDEEEEEEEDDDYEYDEEEEDDD